MKQYLMSVCYPAGATAPAPEALKKIWSDVLALRREMQSAGVWVFSGGLHDGSSATVLRHQGGDISSAEIARDPISCRRPSTRYMPTHRPLRAPTGHRFCSFTISSWRSPQARLLH